MRQFAQGVDSGGQRLMATVVIADDESIIRLDLKEILEGAGYDVVGEASNGSDALRLIQLHEPDLALLDVKMPELDGIEVASAIKGSNTIVVLLTAFSQRDLIESAREANVVAYLVKPFRSIELLPKLASLLNKDDVTPLGAGESKPVDDKIETRDLVARAKQLLMSARGISEEDAFTIIQKTAMSGRTRMRDIALTIIEGSFLD